jgi:signal transduction histidine kinase
LLYRARHHTAPGSEHERDSGSAKLRIARGSRGPRCHRPRDDRGPVRASPELESIGQLAAGIAHEINTPIQYVGDNARFLQDGFARLKPMLGLDRVSAEFREDAEYLADEIPKALEQLLEGVEHVARIVRAMKEFSHPGPPDKTPVDLNRALQNTAMVSRNEWKYIAELVEDLDPALPAVQCVPGEINHHPFQPPGRRVG